MDRIYDLPYTRRPHPSYQEKIGLRDGEGLRHHHARVLRRVHLLLHHRAPGAHHPVRSQASVLRELERMAEDPASRG